MAPHSSQIGAIADVGGCRERSVRPLRAWPIRCPNPPKPRGLTARLRRRKASREAASLHFPPTPPPSVQPPNVREKRLKTRGLRFRGPKWPKRSRFHRPHEPVVIGTRALQINLSDDPGFSFDRNLLTLSEAGWSFEVDRSKFLVDPLANDAVAIPGHGDGPILGVGQPTSRRRFEEVAIIGRSERSCVTF